MPQHNSSSDFGPPLYLAEIIFAALRKRWVILGACLACLAGGVGYLLVAEKEFTAQVLLVPVNEQGGVSGLGSSLDFLPFQGMSGLLGGVTTATETNIALEMMATRSFLRTLLSENRDLAAVLLKDCVIEPVSNKNDDGICTEEEVWKATRNWKKDVFHSGVNEETGIYWVEITLPDPKLAAKVANLTVKKVDQNMRLQKIEETQKNIDYLFDQNKSTNKKEIKETISLILKNQIEQQMLASNDKSYVFRVLDEAVSPVSPSAPKPLLIVLGSVILGLLLGLVLAFVLASRDIVYGKVTVQFSDK